jgi:hypothetical protein
MLSTRRTKSTETWAHLKAVQAGPVMDVAEVMPHLFLGAGNVVLGDAQPTSQAVVVAGEVDQGAAVSRRSDRLNDLRGQELELLASFQRGPELCTGNVVRVEAMYMTGNRLRMKAGLAPRTDDQGMVGVSLDEAHQGRGVG